MPEQVTFWVAADGTQFRTQAEALAWEMKAAVRALSNALEGIAIDDTGTLDAATINGLVSDFAGRAATSTATLATAISAQTAEAASAQT